MRDAIYQWMMRHHRDYVDARTGEVNCTAMVEAWDRECADGGATLDSEHPAWDIAVEVALAVEATL